MSHFTPLLGPQLLTNKGLLPTEDALAGKDKVLLYFSAHWCPPCRGFTPVLAEKYKSAASSASTTEVVFVSSDRDQRSFEGYFNTMPWLALPFSARDTKAALSSKYGIRGIPTLVVLDGKTGELLTKDGRSQVDALFPAASTPAKAPAAAPAPRDNPFVSLLGMKLRGQGGSGGATETLLQDKNYVMLYFSAHWCPPCRGFTPVLAEAYKRSAEAAGVEVVFVSSDSDSQSFEGYFKAMPWLALPYSARDTKAALGASFGVRGIPTLVVLDGKTGKLITKEGRGEFEKYFKNGGGSAKIGLCDNKCTGVCTIM